METNQTNILKAAEKAGKLAYENREKRLSNDNCKTYWEEFRDIQLSFTQNGPFEYARNTTYDGAIPTSEIIGDVFPLENAPVTCIGIAGFQLNPILDHPVLFTWISALAYQRGRGVLHSSSCDLTELLWKNKDNPNNWRNMVDNRRALLELDLARRVVESDYCPTPLIILERSLIPTEGKSNSIYIKKYINKLKCCETGLIASVISFPKSRSLVKLLDLKRGKLDSFNLVYLGYPPDAYLADCLLNEGERTATVMCGSPGNKLLVKEGAGICYFYLKVSGSILRVEIPDWLLDKEAISIIHSSIYKDSKTLKIPNSLFRAQKHMDIDINQTALNRAEQAFIDAGGDMRMLLPKNIVRGKHK